MRDSLPWKLFMELEKDSRSAWCGFKILSTFMLEMGVIFLYGLIIDIRWATWWSYLRIGLLLILA